MADDMGFSDIGCYGSEIRTPNIDALADAGARFRQFYNTGRCCPTRASLVTGLYPHAAGMGWQTRRADPVRPGYAGELRPDTPTIAETLRNAGYGTYMAGKWHLTGFDSIDRGPNGSWPTQRGFDKFFGTIQGGGSFYRPPSLSRGLERLDDNEDTWRGGEFYYTREISDAAVDYIRSHDRERDDDPMFLYVAYTAPHWPMHAPEEDIAEYDGRYDRGYRALRAERFARQLELGVVPDNSALAAAESKAPSWDVLGERQRQRLSRLMETYAAMVTILDEGVGEIIGALDDAGELDQTLVLFLSDNGGCAEGGWTGGFWKDFLGRPYGRDPQTIGTDLSFPAYGGAWANASNTPFREYKHYVHEGGIATPLVVHWPEGIDESLVGGWVDTPAHVIDVAATAIALADTDHPVSFGGSTSRPLAGENLAPLLNGEAFPERRLFWEHEGNRAVRDGDWKLVARGARGAWELYDLANDRGETNDLSDQRPDVVEALGDAWQMWARENDVLPLGRPPQ